MDLVNSHGYDAMIFWCIITALESYSRAYAAWIDHPGAIWLPGFFIIRHTICLPRSVR